MNVSTRPGRRSRLLYWRILALAEPLSTAKPLDILLPKSRELGGFLLDDRAVDSRGTMTRRAAPVNGDAVNASLGDRLRDSLVDNSLVAEIVRPLHSIITAFIYKISFNL